MKRIATILGWLFGVLLALFTVFLCLYRAWLQAGPMLLMAAIVLPPGRRGLARLLRRRPPAWAWPLAFAAAFGLFALMGHLTRPSSIYKSPEIRARVQAIYDAKMQQWPVPHESRFVDTDWGRVHVIVSGPADGPPLLLLHASGVAAWSWKFNAADLSARHRIYAIDLIGDFGRSELKNFDHQLRDGRDQAALYDQIADRLGVNRACVVGASEGGFIATNLALHAPERVSRLVLVGPMGYAGAAGSALRIMFAQMFPTQSIQESTFRWAFSDSPKMLDEFGEWFRLVMSGYNPAKPAPWPFSAEERQRIRVPTLFIFGARDNLVGDPDAATALVQDIPDVRVEVLDTGHLVAAEQPERADRLILDFCGSGAPEEG